MIHTALMFAAIFTLLILSARYLIQRKGSKAIDRDWSDGVGVVADVPGDVQ